MPFTTVLQQLEKAYQQQQVSLDQHPSLHKVRTDAFSLLQTHLTSTATTEKYKYSPIHKLLPEAYIGKHTTNPEAQPQVTPADLSALFPASIDHYAVVLTHGRVHDITYALHQELPFQLTHFSEAAGVEQQLLDSYWARYISTLRDPLAILNTTFFTDGILLQIPANTVLSKPICIYHYPAMPHSITYPRMLISVGKYCQGSIINNWHCLPNQTSYTNGMVDIQLAPHAVLTHYTLQLQGDSASQIIHTNYYQQTHSQVDSHTYTSQHQAVRNNLSCYLEGAYAKHNLYGMYALGGTQHVDNHTTVTHQAPDTESNELYKGVLTDNATGVFNGSICVQPAAQKTNAFQTNNNILLSDSATMHTKPQLQILADDVKCSHGATFGSFDKNQLFYLQARGIPYPIAKKMLLQAFIDEIIQQVPAAALQAFIAKQLESFLQDVA